tara:strand:- start:6192 stop:7514 length:1323 start_codon:yes stop_codon:yes gene_type:complete
MKHKNFKELLKHAYNQKNDSNVPVLLKYTQTISCNLDNIIYNLSYKSKFIYMNFPDNKCYIGVGQTLSDKIKSKKELIHLKKNKYNIISNTDKNLIFLGGASFDLDKKRSYPWKRIPKGEMVIPKLLISQLDNTIKITYIRKIDKNILPSSIIKEYNRYVNLVSNNGKKITKNINSNVKINSEKPNYKTYIKDINAIIKNIQKTTLNKVVISRIVKYSLSNNISILGLIYYLNKKHSNCLNFIISFSKNNLFIGSTPEKIIQLNNKSFTIDAIAGSAKNKNHIVNSKEIAEHNFVIKHIKKEMKNITTTITIPKTPKILNLSYIYHLYTGISGKLKQKSHVLDILTKLYPTPALLGDPNKDALQIINKYEKINRGWYGGSIGLYDNNGNGEFYVPIRSALIKNKDIILFSGSGIISKSNAKKEWEETTLKLSHILSFFKN